MSAQKKYKMYEHPIMEFLSIECVILTLSKALNFKIEQYERTRISIQEKSIKTVFIR